MQIAVITVQREPMYLLDTLADLRASFECVTDVLPQLEVFIGTPDHERIEHAVRCTPNGVPHRMPAAIWWLIAPLPPKLRAVGNFVAALDSGDDDLMLFEDDIAIKPGWQPALAQIRAASGPDALISLYSHRDLRRDGPHADPPHGVALRWPIVDFYGTLGLFVPRAHRAPLAAAARIHLQPTDPRPVEARWPFDEIVKVYVNDHRACSLVVSVPSFVDHRGDVSLINPTHGPRRAPMF